MKKKKIIKLAVGVAIIGTLIGGGSAAYMFYKPHRDVQATKTDYSISNSEITLIRIDTDQTGKAIRILLTGPRHNFWRHVIGPR